MISNHPNPIGGAGVALASGAVAQVGTSSSSSTDNALARFDGTTGKVIQTSPIIVTDAGALEGLQVTVTPKTQAASPYTVTNGDSGKVFTNEGASSIVTFNLPTAVAGLEYTFVVQDADGLTVVASAGDTIRIATAVSAVAGNISATAIGATVRLVAINATEWVSVATNGTITVN